MNNLLKNQTEGPIDKSWKYDSLTYAAYGDENKTINDFDWICDGSLISDVKPRSLLPVLGVLKSNGCWPLTINKRYLNSESYNYVLSESENVKIPLTTMVRPIG